ncbi:MAG TPA: hypothetical protein VHD87_15140 [Acidimicrobiales bacterium]|nr:hypothetical protein [Acidimicrobiales bacterium]
MNARDAYAMGRDLFRRDRQPPIIWGPVERAAQAAAATTVLCVAALLAAAAAGNTLVGDYALVIVAFAAPTYLVTAAIGTYRYEKRRRAAS